VSLVIQNRHNTITSTLVSGIVKEIDDTPLPETESEVERILKWSTYREIIERLDEIEKRVANLETQRTPQDENDDPEWY
jgi:hypothetical protein